MKVENMTGTEVIETTKKESHTIVAEPSRKVFEKKKTIFRFYQIIWYALGVIETLLLFRFALKALGANPFSGFVDFIYAITQPLVLPFLGIFPFPGNSRYLLEWSTIIAMVVYAVLAYALVEVFQFIKPVSKEEVEQTVDEQ